VDEQPAGSAFLRDLEQTEQVGDVAVDAAVGEQSHQVDGPALTHSAVDRLEEHGVRVDGAVGDREIDPREFLIDHAAGSDVEVTDLRVAHLVFRQPHVLPGAGHGRPGEALEEPVQGGSVRERHGVAGTRRRKAVAVHDHEQSRQTQPIALDLGDRVESGIAHLAACTMSAKDDATSAAPPTSAPSMSGSPKNIEAFSGLTDPP